MLTIFQQLVLRTLATNRTPASHVAGGAALNRARPRATDDIDIFNDAADAVDRTAALDIATLRQAGLVVPDSDDPPRRGFIERTVHHGPAATRVQWAFDSAVRFLPPVEDPAFGYRLSDPDLAVNKLLALAGRSTARDVIDIVDLNERGFPLATLAWAAPGKDAGFTPLSILDWVTRNASHVTIAEWNGIASGQPVDPVAVRNALLGAVATARTLIGALPAGPTGHLFLSSNGAATVPTKPLVEAASQGRALATPGITVLAASVGGAVASIPDP